MQSEVKQGAISVRFCQPPDALRRYVTTFHLVEFHFAPGEHVVDYLNPEWANLRFFSGATPVATSHDGRTLTGSRFSVTGPTSHALRFAMPATRMWGIGLLPLGWARFVAAPAIELADRTVDGESDPGFAGFAPLAARLFGPEPDREAELARLTDHFTALPGGPLRDEPRILALHEALVDPDVGTVGELVRRVGASPRTVERIAAQAFGFTPMLLLRRQRFMRSLAQYMLDPSLKWIGALDGHYHDQAHFIRDFHQFMGMSPREYAQLDKPILSAVMRARDRDWGSAAQTLDSPQGGTGR